MSIRTWIIAGLVAAVSGGALACAFRLPSLILASIAFAAGGVIYAQSHQAALSTQIAFAAVLLAALQAAYLAVAIAWSRNKK